MLDASMLEASAAPCGLAALGALAGALAIDALFGDPPNRFHPVAWMGSAASALLRLAPRRGDAAQLAFGAVVAIAVPALFAAAAWLLLRASSGMPGIEVAVAAVLLKPTFAIRALRDAAFDVRDALARGDLAAARRSLASLCSRDASRLDEAQVAAAAVESVAENASDSAVAPLLYFALLGLPAAVAYRAVNTLDAMIGYHGPTEMLGKAAARLDDLANLVPARLTALLLLAGGALVGADARAGARILRRDGARTESPNAGRPMAAMAGLLGVALEKPGHYRLGDARRPLAAATIDEAWRVVRAALALAVTTLAAALLAAGASGG